MMSAVCCVSLGTKSTTGAVSTDRQSISEGLNRVVQVPDSVKTDSTNARLASVVNMISGLQSFKI